MTYHKALPPVAVPRALPSDFADHGPCVEEFALALALHDAAAGELLIEMLVGEAIRQWRLDDATFWQRVKFKARMIRATRRSASGPDDAAILPAHDQDEGLRDARRN